MSKISVGSDPRCDAIFPDQAPAILTITKRNGERVVEETLVNRASPEVAVELSRSSPSNSLTPPGGRSHPSSPTRSERMSPKSRLLATSSALPPSSARLPPDDGGEVTTGSPDSTASMTICRLATKEGPCASGTSRGHRPVLAGSFGSAFAPDGAVPDGREHAFNRV